MLDKSYDIKDGLKAGEQAFPYSDVVMEEGKKRTNYCVWIEDEALPGFGKLVISIHRLGPQKFWTSGSGAKSTRKTSEARSCDTDPKA